METTGPRLTSSNARPYRFIYNDDGCYVCISHTYHNTVQYLETWRSFNGKNKDYFHRIIYAMKNGPIPDGYHIDHKCQNKLCCNPDHLQALTAHEHGKKSAREKAEKKALMNVHQEKQETTH